MQLMTLVAHCMYTRRNPPTSATEYAKDQFSHFHSEMFVGMGFSANEVANMRLSPGFQAIPYDSTIEFADNLYCYPVMSNDKIVAVMKVTYYDGKYNYQLEIGEFAQGLNELLETNCSSISIILSENAYYAVTSNGISVLQTFADTNKENIPYERSALDSGNAISAYTTRPSQIEISCHTTYSEYVQSPSYARNLQSVLIGVPIVPNYYIDSYGNYHGGVCWAASVGSLAAYFNYGSTSYDNSMACHYRDIIVEEHLTYYPGIYGGQLEECPYYMRKYTNRIVSVNNSKLDWPTLVYDIFNLNNPSISCWSPIVPNAAGHIMVLCGAEYDASDPANQNYWSIALMDPNHAYTVIGYNSIFVDGNYAAMWQYTIR